MELHRNLTQHLVEGINNMKIKSLINSSLVFFFVGCTTFESPDLTTFETPDLESRPSKEPSKPKAKSYTIIELNGKQFSEEENGSFEIWECHDYFKDKVLLEVGRFTTPDLSNYGFILYDGTASGDLTRYQRDGINKRWDWETESGRYSFIIKPNGTGLFYDFSNVPDGESTKAKDSFRCKKK